MNTERQDGKMEVENEEKLRQKNRARKKIGREDTGKTPEREAVEHKKTTRNTTQSWNNTHI
jgi:hypothetical protein